jgi:hypothetical protein
MNMSNTTPTSARKSEESIRLLTLQRMYDLLMAALSFVAALAWNDAIQSLFVRIFGPASTLFAKFLYALVLTVIIVYLGTRITRLTRALEQRFKNHS